MATGVEGVRARAILACVAGLALSSAAFGSVVFQTIALSNTDGALGPGMGTGTAFTSASGAALAAAVCNNQDNVMFLGATGLTGGPPFPAVQNVGIFGWNGGGNVVRALSGGLASDGVAYTTNLNFPNIQGGGNYAFRETTSAAHAGNGATVGVAGRTTPASTMPGTGGATLNAVSTSPQILANDSGMIGFRGNLNTGTGVPAVTSAANVNNQGGLWSGPAGGLVLRARNNDPTPIANVNLGIIDSGVAAAVMNNTGEFVFTGGLQSTTAGAVVTGAAGNDLAVFRSSSTGVSVLGRKGDAAPGTNVPGEQYRTFANPGFNHAGHVSWVSSMRVGSTTSDSAIFRDVGSGVGMVVRGTTTAALNVQALMPASTGFNNAYWGNIYSDVVMNGSGDLAFKATGLVSGTGGATGTDGAALGTSNSGGLFTASATGQIRCVMQLGTAASQATGAIYSSFQSGFGFNNAGQAAWVSLLVDDPAIATTDVWTDVTAPSGQFGNNLALYCTNTSGAIELVLRKNDVIEVTPGDFRRVRAFAVAAAAGAEDGRAEFLNDAGRLAVSVTFSDFSSAVLYYTVPTPGATALLGLGGLVAVRRRRRS